MAARWRITNQRQQSALDGNNRFIEVMTITFTSLPSDTIGSVDVPVSRYNPEAVQELVQARADAIEAVAALGGA